MKKWTITGLSALAVMGFAAYQGFATAKAKMQDGNIVINFSYAGVPTGVEENFSVAASGTAVYACVDENNRPIGGGHIETVNKTTYAEGLFEGNSDGVVKEILSMSPPEPATMTCSAGHKKMLASSTYKDVRVRNISDDVTRNIRGNFTRHIIWIR